MIRLAWHPPERKWGPQHHLSRTIFKFQISKLKFKISKLISYIRLHWHPPCNLVWYMKEEMQKTKMWKMMMVKKKP